MSRAISVVLDGYTYFECPRWRAGRIWVSDFYTHQVVSARPDGSDVRVEAIVPQQPSGLGWLPDGRLLVVSMRDRRVMRREADGTLVEHADLSRHATGHANDMVVDAAGRAYVGNFGFDLMGGGAVATADLVRVDPDGSVHVVARDLHFPNGMAITADGELLVNETIGNRISAFAIQPDGGLGDRRDWATFGPVPSAADVPTATQQIVVAPDGSCLAPDGSLWVADALGGRVVRVAGGAIVEQIQLDAGAFACGLGGEDGQTLFVCSAPDFNEHQRKLETRGRLLAVQLG